MDYGSIFLPIRKHLLSVEKELKNQIPTGVPLSKEILKHLLLRPGKRLRPSIVLLSALSVNNRINKNIIFASAAVELLHNASIIHDDIVDEAKLRRGVKSANNIWGDHATVLAGDYLLAKSLFLINKSKNPAVMSSVTAAASELANGQILDIMLSKREIPFNEKIYFKMINLKTASLISSSSEIGAMLSGANRSTVNSMRKYGVSLGISYQLIDDVLDFIGDSKNMGKKAMSDIKEGKVSLPMLICLKNLKKSESYKPKNILINKNFNRSNLSFLYNLVLDSEAIEETIRIANNYSLKAVSSLKNLKDSKFKEALINLARVNSSRMY
ncbi:MAG: polyprenyl synthetase family protein [Thermodesulfobacteriota bacterium]|nr:polyprenyl synthetase family protein [Thermodesulfobacteriota bacterium]|tara:strand:- start:244 stop:1224 length:981 start_codon:yes stop_codon:yes gene_type:complete